MLDDHKKAFIEEASELLTSLESGLLELEENPEDSDLIARIFRALHTIKGSSGMFGFDEITIFTHDIETIFDYVRNGQIPVTKEIIDLTLQARDQISAMLQESEGEKYVNDSIVQDLVVKFRNIVLNYKMLNESPAEDVKPLASAADMDRRQPSDRSLPETAYYILFRPARNTFLSGTNPLLLIEELRQLGQSFVLFHSEEIPLLEQINPEECYSYWEILLLTDKGQDSIKDVFIFVEDSCELLINPVDLKNRSDIDGMWDYLKNTYSGGNSLTLQLAIETFKSTPKTDILPSKMKKTREKEEKHGEPETVSSIRVSSEKLDNLVNLVGELVTVQARLTQTANKSNQPELSLIAEEVERLTWELRDNALNIRMLPIGTTFSKFKRLVRDLSQELGKEVDLITEGAETELDKTVIEKLNDPLVHIIRNSIDHGVETPAVRKSLGKSEIGKITLSASQSGGNVLIKIIDDGAGLNKDLIQEKAISKGLISAGVDLKDSEIYSLIFMPGFSTAKQVTNVSGRGVGMDVVKQAIDNLRGSIEIESKQGIGTTITLKLPLTLAIIDGLLVQISEEFFILPLSAVEECIELTSESVANSHGRNIVKIRGEIIPYIRLRDNYNIKDNIPAIEQVVITTINKMKVGFAVDRVIGSHQTVLKNLGRVFKHVEGVSGATILGDGTVALILDIQKIVAEEEIREKQLVA
ncbi:MAG: chemotaxis protein CheA [Bacteroidota bacterium]|nr:chemotaxis protein CheA [Bacteroidota bacterium]MDP4195522.1 chemotaxis protein CheA [Bacteroidota bacterium]